MITLFLEILSPAKILSKGFRNDQIGVVKAVNLLKQGKKQFERIDKKEYYQLPSVKRFVNKVESSDDGTTTFQGIQIKDYENALGFLENSKNEITEMITDAISIRVEDSETEANKLCAVILNTESWVAQSDDEFLNDEVLRTCELFEIPLKRAGFSASPNEILHSLLDYSTTYLNVDTFCDRKVWKLIYSSSRSGEWKVVLLLVELLFCSPISNAIVERFFSLQNKVKTDGRASVGEKRLNSLLRICTEGPECEHFDATKAMHMWANNVIRRPNQNVSKDVHSKTSQRKLHYIG